MPIQVAIVDDNRELADSIVQNLGMYSEIAVMFYAESGQEFFEQMQDMKRKPDVVLMDIEMPGMNGIEVTRLLNELYPEIKIVILTVFDDDTRIFDAIQAGANGYLLKDAKPARIVSAIEDVLEGGVAMSPAVANKTLELLLNYAPQGKHLKTPQHYKLSERETEVLKLLATGKSYHQLAELLFISPKTVRGHIERIYDKLHVHNKLEAVQVAQKNRWL